MALITEQSSPNRSILKRKGSAEEFVAAKRPKVTFSSSLTESAGEKPFSLVEEEVRRALVQQHQGKSHESDIIKSRLLADPLGEDGLSDTALHHHLVALTNHALNFGDSSGELMNAILNCTWLHRDTQLVNDMCHFLTILLTSFNGYTSQVVKWILSQFANVRPVALSGGSSPLEEKVIFRRLHHLLQLILVLVPSSKTILETNITSSFPFYIAPTKQYISYFRNILDIKTYHPELGPVIVRSLIGSTLDIDARVAADLEPLDETDEDALVEWVEEEMPAVLSGHMPEDDSDEDSDEDDTDRHEDLSDPEVDLQETKRCMIKLDYAMNALFEYYDSIFSDSQSDMASTNVSSTFKQLLSTFTGTILPVHNLRSLQYLLFYFVQRDQNTFYDPFVNSLFQAAANRNLALPVRCAAISYLASFTARGSKISPAKVRAIFYRLSDEFEKLRVKLELSCIGPDPDRFRYYYTGFQALMYIFCFRWRAFLQPRGPSEEDAQLAEDAEEDFEKYDNYMNPELYQWYPGIKEFFTRHCFMSRLNPLKACSSVLVDMFAKVTHELKFLYLFSRIEQNTRIHIVRSIQFSGGTRESNRVQYIREADLRLSNHFPFEPYLLPLGKKWIEDFYVNFETAAPQGMQHHSDDEDDEDDEDGENDEDEDEDEDDE